MSSKAQYSSLPSDDAEGGGVRPLEMEGAHARHGVRKKRRSFTYTATCLFVLLLVMVGYGAHKGGGRSRESPHPEDSKRGAPAELNGSDGPRAEDGSAEGSADDEPAAPAKAPRYVFCYGDSLTFGMSGMHSMVGPGQGPFPYARYLEEELNVLYDSPPASAYNASDPETEVPAAIVEHLGLPGWSSGQMLDHLHDQTAGVCNILDHDPTPSLIIILAGTNDVLQMTDSSKSVARTIVSQMVDLHKGALECSDSAKGQRAGPKGGLRSMVLGIPGGAFQEKVPVTAETSSYINGAMKSFAESYPGGRVTYVDFPIPYREGDARWSEDGIHLTKEGYEALGKDLAPRVKDILDAMDAE